MKIVRSKAILIVSLALIVAFVFTYGTRLLGNNAALAQGETKTQKELVKQGCNCAKKAEEEARENFNSLLSRYLSTKAMLAAKNPSIIDGFEDLAALLAVQSTKVKKDYESISNALRTLQSFPHLSNTLWEYRGHAAGGVFSPDGTKIIAFSGGRSVSFWDVETGQTIGKPWLGHDEVGNGTAVSPIYEISFSSDGTKVISLSKDHTVRYWDIKTGKIIGESWQGYTNHGSNTRFSPDGTKVVFSSRNDTIHLWDVETGEAIGNPWLGHTDSVNSISFSPDSTK